MEYAANLYQKHCQDIGRRCYENHLRIVREIFREYRPFAPEDIHETMRTIVGYQVSRASVYLVVRRLVQMDLLEENDGGYTPRAI